MELPGRRQVNHAGGETSAGVKLCQHCHLMVRLVVLGSAILMLALVVVFSLVGAFTSTKTADPTSQSPGKPRSSVCPPSWRWWSGHCYFFSVGLEENRRWNESDKFCLRHNSSLAVIKDSAEMDFIQGVMGNFSRHPFLWVGLTDAQQEGRWLWLDGADIQHYMPLNIEWDADHRDCADLRGNGSLFAADCEEVGPWTCKRES